ncbi:hypothetical protein TorRG33x02_110330, partial [Trema orientale]
WFSFSVGCNDENFVAVCGTSSIFFLFFFFFFPVKCSFSRGKVKKLEEWVPAEAASNGHFGGSNLWMHSCSLFFSFPNYYSKHSGIRL